MVDSLELCRMAGWLQPVSAFSGWFGQLSVFGLGLSVKCCDWCDTSFGLLTDVHAQIHTYKIQKDRHIYTHKSAYVFWKHTPNHVQSRVCLVWDTSQASHILHNTRAGVGTETTDVACSCLKITPSEHGAVLVKSPHKIFHFVDLSHISTLLLLSLFSLLRFWWHPSQWCQSRWLADGKHLLHTVCVACFDEDSD